MNRVELTTTIEYLLKGEFEDTMTVARSEPAVLVVIVNGQAFKITVESL